MFVLAQSRLLYQSYRQQIAKRDQEIEKLSSRFEPRVEPDRKPLPPDRKRNRNAPKKRRKRGLPDNGFDLRTETHKLFGVDVTQMPGLEMSVLPLFSEVGRELSRRWRTAPRLVAWLNWRPDNDLSGGGVLWKGPRKIQNRAGPIFRMAAYALHRSPTPLGNYLRRRKAQLGPKAASTATAHKIAVIFTPWLPNKLNTTKAWGPRARPNARLEDKIKRQAKQLGYKLVPLEEKPAA